MIERRTLKALLVAAAICSPSAPARADELELVLRAGPVISTAGDENVADVGPAGGVTALLRLGEHFALGGLMDTAWLAWDAPGPADGLGGAGFPDDEGSLQSTLYALSLRWYPLSAITFPPYVEASAGYVSVLEIPDHPDCGDGSGFSGQLALGIDWQAASWARLGAVTSARPYLAGRGCNTIGYSSRAPNPPFVQILLSGQLVFTTVWSRR